MKKVLVTGANGQLGQSLGEVSLTRPAFDFSFVSKEQLNVADKKQLDLFFNNNSFDFVINCSAYTAVDKAESDIENARMINTTAVAHLSEITSKHNISFIHISTDYVFDGNETTPRLETDNVNPIGIYGQTKLEGERLALQNNSKTIIIRTSWIYSIYGNNFVKTMLRLFKEKQEIGVIDDQVGSPTNANDLAEAIVEIISNESLVYGIFNYSNEGKCTWFEFAVKIKEFVNSSIIIKPIPTTAYPTPAKRPVYSLLDKTKIKNTYKLTISDWQASLVKELKKIIN